MSHVDSQGWETVSNPNDALLQGFLNNMGWTGFSKPSSRFARSRSFQFEDSLATATDVSPSFAGTTAVQKNTGKLISDLWAAGGFAFGAAAKMRDLTQQYSYGEFTLPGVSNVGTTGSFSRTMKACYGNGKYWALRTPVSAGTAAVAADAIASSTDLVTWTATATTPVANSTQGFYNQIAYLNGLLLVSYAQFPGGGPIGTHYAVSSNDGATWTAKTIPALSGQTYTVSNIVYVAANSTYYLTASYVADGTHRTFKTTDPVNGTWTQIDAYALSGGGGISTCLELIFDSNRNVVWQSAGNTQNGGITAARLRSFTAPGEVFTNNWTTTGAGNNSSLIPVSVAFSASIIVAVLMSGAVIRSTDGTTWTNATGPTNAMSVVYNASTGQFVLCTTAGGAQYSTDGTNWTAMTVFGLTSTVNTYRLMNNYVSIMNGQLVMFGRPGTFVAPLTNPTGWILMQRSEMWRSSVNSGTANRAARLGVAAVNSSGRQGYVGVGFQGDLNSTAGTLVYLPGNAITDSTTYPTSPISYLYQSSPWHYYTLIFTATATQNQFVVQVVVDGTVLSSFTSTVQLAPTNDTTSTLYWTLPCRDVASSSVQPSLVEFDDIYVFDNSSTVNNTAMLDCHIVREELVSDVQAQWTKTPASAASNAVAASGLSVSSAPGNVSSTVNGNKDIYATDQTLDITAYSVKAVSVEAVLSNSGLPSSSAAVGLVSGSSAVDTGAIAVSAGGQNFARRVQETDPATSGGWSRNAAKAANVTIQKVS